MEKKFKLRKNEDYTVITKYGYFNLINGTSLENYLYEGKVTRDDLCLQHTHSYAFYHSHELYYFFNNNPNYVLFYISKELEKNNIEFDESKIFFDWNDDVVETVNIKEFLNNYYKMYEKEFIFIKEDNMILLCGYYDQCRKIKKETVIERKFNMVKIKDKYAELIYNMCNSKVNTSMIQLFIKCLEYKENNIDTPFKFSYIPKSDGTKRLISEPYPELKEILKEMNSTLNTAFSTRLDKKESNQFAYIKKRNIKDNALVHTDNKYVIKTDISHFFDYCNYDLCKKYLTFLMGDLDSYRRNEVFKIIKCAIISKNTNGLYMGNPISGVLSNMILHPAMVLLNNICEKENISLSVYADDITFSTNIKDNEKFCVKRIINMVKYVFEYYELPFKLKREKTKVVNNNMRRVTGIRINHNDKLTTDRHNYMLMKSICEHLKHGKEITLTPAQVQGRLNFYCYIDRSGKFARLVYKYYDTLIKNDIHISKKFINMINQKEDLHEQLTMF